MELFHEFPTYVRISAISKAVKLKFAGIFASYSISLIISSPSIPFLTMHATISLFDLINELFEIDGINLANPDPSD